MCPAPASILALVERFALERHTLNATELRVHYIDPLFAALEWDVDGHERRGVVHEDELRPRDAPESHDKAPDYGFYLGRPGDATRQFFVEARRPGVNPDEARSAAFQLRRYAWSANLPVSILTDFAELAIYDTRIPPRPEDDARTARVKYWRHEQYVEQWDDIAGLLSRNSVAHGSLLEFGQTAAAGAIRVDDALLAALETWRAELAQDIAQHNDVTAADLDTAVRGILDRILFLRIAEARGIEAPRRLAIAAAKKNVFYELQSLFREADDRYNTGLFHPRKEQRPEPGQFTPQLLKMALLTF